jgi:hypothetical protein
MSAGCGEDHEETKSSAALSRQAKDSVSQVRGCNKQALADPPSLHKAQPADPIQCGDAMLLKRGKHR